MKGTVAMHDTLSAARAVWLEQRRAIESGAVSGLGRRPAGGAARWARRGRRALEWLVRGLGLDERGRRNARDVRLERLVVCSARVPAAFDGYRILHVTDTHFDALAGLIEAIGAAADGLTVDLVALTGDYRMRHRGDPAPVVQGFTRLLAGVRCRDGVVATLGNHDTSDLIAPMERLGITVLGNERRHAHRDGGTLSITGIDDVVRYGTAMARAALNAPEPDGFEGFRIALAHSPGMAEVAAGAGFDFFVCGHTHGGQICVPGSALLVSGTRAARDLVAGAWRRGGMAGYTSRGAGVSSLPYRFFSRGEITLIELRRADGADGVGAPTVHAAVTAAAPPR